MQINKVYSVKTIDRVASELGETVDRIFDLAIDMEPEDGVIWVYGPNDDSVTAFSPFGIENLRELIEMDCEPPRVYRRVKHSKDEPYDEETIHPRLSG